MPAAGLQAGDPIDVAPTLSDRARDVEVPTDLAAALAADLTAAAFFTALSNSVQRFYIDTINFAKTDPTRQRRVGKAIALFRDGRPR